MGLNDISALLGQDSPDVLSTVRVAFIKTVQENGQFLISHSGRMYIATATNTLQLSVNDVVYATRESTTGKWFILGRVT